MNGVSIYGPQVSQADAGQWLKNNPTKVNDPQLLKVADYNVSGSVDAMELSKAASNGVVILDGIHSFRFAESKEAKTQSRQVSAPVKEAKGSGIAKAPLGIAVMMGSMFGGIALAKAQPALGIGVMMAGIMVGIGIATGD